jgi:hypothetical protein
MKYQDKEKWSIEMGSKEKVKSKELIDDIFHIK